MTFQEWYDKLGPQIPHGHVAQMAMAWNAALEEAAKHFDPYTWSPYKNPAITIREMKRTDAAPMPSQEKK